MKPDIRGAVAMQQVTDWLEKLGLGQYAQRFSENDIDFALVAKLTDADHKVTRTITVDDFRKAAIESVKAWRAECGARQ